MSKATTRVRLALLPTALAMGGLSVSAEALAQTITIDGTGSGRTYEGIGAVSGGGGTSPLLMDYVEPQRTQILDYLFRPNYGAALQELYVEVGGDGNSTQGSELSHMHTKTDENYYRGYEWWLMEQARARNPAIFLDATAWSAPAWVGNGNFWSQDTADYLSKWIKGAKSAHGLDIDYVGCRNEKGNNESWVKLFRTTLDSNGLTNVGIHAFDNWGSTSWTWATDMNTDATLKAAVYAIGSHTTSSYGSTKGTPPPANVIAIGKPMWDTEEHVYEHGFQCAIDIVGAFNFNYVNSKITKTIYWYLIPAFYSNEPFYDNTMAVASSPWSGNYTINPALWGYAHVGQFTKTGWKYLDAASGTFSETTVSSRRHPARKRHRTSRSTSPAASRPEPCPCGVAMRPRSSRSRPALPRSTVRSVSHSMRILSTASVRRRVSRRAPPRHRLRRTSHSPITKPTITTVIPSRSAIGPTTTTTLRAGSRSSLVRTEMGSACDRW